MRQATNRLARFYQLVSAFQIEMLEQRILLSTANPIGPPPLPPQPEPLQGVVGTPQSLDPQLLNDAYGFNEVAYDVNGTTIAGDGAGQTIAIVDPYGSPTIVNDLQTFDAHWGISNDDAGGGFCLTIQALSTPAGQTPSTDTGDELGWAGETSLDVEWAHAVAPGAHILLVEAPLIDIPVITEPNATQNLDYHALYEQEVDDMDAVVYAANQTGVVAVSMSWQFNNATIQGPAATPSTPENINPNLFDGYLVTPTTHSDNDGALGDNAGVTFLAASGDDDTGNPNVAGDTGYLLSWPATSINTVSVGGEYVDVGLNGQIQVIGPWNDNGDDGNPPGASGGGPNPNYSSPKYNVPIVALDASPLTGVWVYDSNAGGWEVVGGTSFSCPAWAGLTAIIDQGLMYRGIASLTTAEMLSGYTPTPTVASNFVADFPTGILTLAEGGVTVPAQSPYIMPDGHDSFEDFNTLTAPPPLATAYPLWPNPPDGPDISVTPANGNTGWGAPNTFFFVEDMVSYGTTGFSTIEAATTPQLDFTVQPQNEEAGQTFSVTLTAFFPNGTEDTSFNGSVDLGLLSGTGASLNSEFAPVTASNGVATFNGLAIDTVGSYQLIASANNSNGVDSSTFTISPAPTAALNFITQPTSQWQFGISTSPIIVGIEDQYGNVETAVNSSVTLSIKSGPVGGAITGDTVAVASQGRATFSGLSFSVAGTYILLARDGSLSVSSNAFAVVPIPVLIHYTFNGAALSAPALRQELLRNAVVYTSKGAPTEAEVVAAVAADTGSTQSLFNESYVAAAPVPVDPSTFAAPADVSSVSSQLLGTGDSGDNQLLDN